MNKTLAIIQNELHEWTMYNFGQQDASIPIMGMIEEHGELTHATLKQMQNIRQSDYLADKKDAVADLVIYLLNYFNCKQKTIKIIGDFSNVEMPSSYGEYKCIIYINKHISNIATFNETRAGIHNIQIGVIQRLLAIINHYCKLNDFDLLTIVNEVWEQVKLRDWKLYPINGKTE